MFTVQAWLLSICLSTESAPNFMSWLESGRQDAAPKKTRRIANPSAEDVSGWEMAGA